MATCNEEGCSALTIGKCVNGLELDICPHYSIGDDNILGEENIDDEDLREDDDVQENVNDAKKENLKDVHTGKALTLSEANRLAKSVLTRLIVLAGMPEAGKTTLLLSLMHLFFNKLSYEGYVFAGSETLLDFEEKSHPSKIDSEINKPNTGRTPFGPPTFMHIKVAEKDNAEKKTDLLFTDISGETFKALKDSTDECKKFGLCDRADHFTLFFDTKDLTSIKDRANSKTAGLGMLRGLIEAGTLLPHTKIQIVFSKWDLFNEEKGKNHLDFLEILKSEIMKIYGQRFSISFHEISCRPKDSSVEFGHGLDKLFLSWVSKSQLDDNRILDSQPENEFDLREYMKFKHNE